MLVGLVLAGFFQGVSLKSLCAGLVVQIYPAFNIKRRVANVTMVMNPEVARQLLTVPSSCMPSAIMYTNNVTCAVISFRTESSRNYMNILSDRGLWEDS